MPHQPHRPAVLAYHVFRGSEAIRRGVITEHQLRSRAWLRLRHDVYGDARLARDHALACRGALARLPSGTVLAGPSAAFLHGIEHAAAFGDDVHVIVRPPVRIGVQQGLRVHHLDLEPADSHRGEGPPRTAPARTAWEVAAWLPPPSAVPIVDALLHRGLVDGAALDAVADRLEGRPGSRRAREAFALADAAAETPDESRLRVSLVRDGLPRPAVRHPVSIGGGRVLRPHLAWPELRVAVDHVVLRRRAGDPRRLDVLATFGWRVVHVHGGRPGAARERVRSTLEEAGWCP